MQTRASKKFPQIAYVAMKNFLQMECQYVHRTVSDAGVFFDGVEEAIASKFLPSLFGVDDYITCHMLISKFKLILSVCNF